MVHVSPLARAIGAPPDGPRARAKDDGSAVNTQTLRPAAQIERTSLDEIEELGVAADFPQAVRASYIEYTAAIDAYRETETFFRDQSLAMGPDAGQGARRIIEVDGDTASYRSEYDRDRVTNPEALHYHIANVINLTQTRANFLEQVQLKAEELCANIAIHTQQPCEPLEQLEDQRE